jgi:hypothetical protein
LSRQYVITANHCHAELASAGSILFNYTSDNDYAALVRVPFQLPPVDQDDRLDFAILRLVAAAPPEIQPLSISHDRPKAGMPLLLLHHPLGLQLHATRGNCRVVSTGITEGANLYHLCDTEPGSSGGPVLEEDTGEVIALHLGQRSSIDPMNVAVLMSEIVSRPDVAALINQGLYVARANPDTAAAPAGMLSRSANAQENLAPGGPTINNIASQIRSGDPATLGPAIGPFHLGMTMDDVRQVCGNIKPYYVTPREPGDPYRCSALVASLPIEVTVFPSKSDDKSRYISIIGAGFPISNSECDNLMRNVKVALLPGDFFEKASKSYEFKLQYDFPKRSTLSYYEARSGCFFDVSLEY